MKIMIDKEILKYRCVKESLLYTKRGDRVRCDLCERRCHIPLNGLGFCKTRANIDGKLYTLVYGDISSISSNPIEKKPFFHYYPGSYALTIGTWSCNFTCPWCLPHDSLVLTQEGITTVEDVFSQVKKGFEVKIYTHKGRFRRIVKAFAHEFQGSLIRFKPAYLNQEISITPSHRVLVCWHNQLRWVPASQLIEGDIVLVPIPKEGSDFHPVLDLKETILPELKPLRKRRCVITKEIYASDSDQTERILSLMQGSDVKLEEREKGKIFGYIDGKYLYLKIREMKRVPYDGVVYDFEVEDDHSFTTPFIVVSNCQNYDISRYYPEPYKANYINPEDFVNLALSEGCQGLSFSFNEPTLLFEYAVDVFPLARKLRMYANYVSNGYMTLEALRALKEAGMDAIKFDVKGNADAVRKFCAAKVETVWRNVSEARKMGLHIEVVNLIIPKVNDDEFSIREIVQNHIKEAGEYTPLHFTRFYPAYKMVDRAPTPISTLEKAHEIAKKEGLKYVYIGNVPGHRFESTYCHNCNELLIKRYGFSIVKYSINSDKRCPKCREKIPIFGNYVNQSPNI